MDETEWVTEDRLRQEFGDVLVRFAGYYKYTFTFIGDLPDGHRLAVYVGGDSDSIYRMSVGTEAVAVKSLEPEGGSILPPSPAPVEGRSNE